MVVPGDPPADGADGGGEPGRASVVQVVAGHAGDHGVGQAHTLHRLGHPFGLGRVEREGMAGVHLAEAAGPRAPDPLIMKVAVPSDQHS